MTDFRIDSFIKIFVLGETTKKPSTNLKNSQSTTILDKRNSQFPTVNSSPSLDKMVNTLSSLERLNVISENVHTNSLYLSRVSATLPHKDPYLKVILGGVDVSILNKADKWRYKQEYEKFKFIITIISLVSSLVIWSLTSRYRAFDALFHFLLVWYYCTLTIRESILIVNGSNINRKFKRSSKVDLQLGNFSLVESTSFYCNSRDGYSINLA